MSGSSLQFAFLNTTTIENLTRRSKVWQLACYIARPPSYQNGIGFPSVTYPLGGEASTGPKRTFSILHSKPGDNPWDLGPFANFKSVMGLHWYDWFFPLRHSPCRDHSGGESQFELGQVVERMRAEAGIAPPREPTAEPHSSPKSRWDNYRSRESQQDGFKSADAIRLQSEGMRPPKEHKNATNREKANVNTM